MSDRDKIGLFAVIVALGVVAGKASARLAHETGVPAALIGIVATLLGHGLAGEI